MASSPGVSLLSVSSHTAKELPKFMPPVTLDSSAPHPYLPFQPDPKQFIIPPKDDQESTSVIPPQSPENVVTSPQPQAPKDILVAARLGDLLWVKRYCQQGQSDMADNMGEVIGLLVYTGR